MCCFLRVVAAPLSGFEGSCRSFFQWTVCDGSGVWEGLNQVQKRLPLCLT